MKARPRRTSELLRDSRLEVTSLGTPWCGSISAMVLSNFPEKFFEEGEQEGEMPANECVSEGTSVRESAFRKKQRFTYRCST